MNLLIWITIGFIVIGFFILVSMKKSMEMKVSLIIENENNIESKQISNKPIIWWIVGATIWGLISIFLVVQSFSTYF